MTKNRKVLFSSTSITIISGIALFALILSPVTIEIPTGGLIDTSKAIISIENGPEVTAGDLAIIMTVISAIFGISYGVSNSVIKKA